MTTSQERGNSKLLTASSCPIVCGLWLPTHSLKVPLNQLAPGAEALRKKTNITRLVIKLKVGNLGVWVKYDSYQGNVLKSSWCFLPRFPLWLLSWEGVN